MTALAASDVTVTVDERWIAGVKRHVRGKITFGDGALTYSTGGIPLPGYASFGMTRNLDSLILLGNNARTTDYRTQWDRTNNKLLLYEEEAVAAGGPLLEADTGEAPAARDYYFEAIGW